MKKLICALAVCIVGAASADVWRLDVESSPAAYGAINGLLTTARPYQNGELKAAYIYECVTNSAASVVTNTIKLVSGNGKIIEDVGTIVIGAAATSGSFKPSSETLIGKGDVLTVVGTSTNRPFKASFLLITK